MKKKRSLKKKILLLVILIVVLVAALLLGAYIIFAHYYGMMNYVDADEETWVAEDLEEEEEESTDIAEATDEELADIESDLEANLEAMEESSTLTTDSFNILLIGVDARSDSNTGRSDCMILISVDEEDNVLTMTSFLRDIYCTIPGYGNNRLNAAYAYGGPSLLIETLSQNFGITVDKYVVVNFYSVVDLIDAVGGVDLEVTAEEIEVMNDYIESQNSLFGYDEGTDLISTSDAGYMHLDGNQALAYARVRYVGTDFARTGRQREIVELVIEKAADMSLSELLDLMEEFLPQVTTDLTQGDCASLILELLNVSSYSVNSMSIPVDGTWSDANINGMAVLTIDFQANLEAWYETVEGTAVESSEEGTEE